MSGGEGAQHGCDAVGAVFIEAVDLAESQALGQALCARCQHGHLLRLLYQNILLSNKVEDDS